MKTQQRKPAAAKRGRKPNGGLSPQQIAKYKELQRWIRRSLAESEKMTPAQRAKADADWEKFKKGMNEDRRRVGARLLYID